MSVVTRAVAAVLVACILTSCGVPAESEPHEVELPRGALTTSATQPSGTATVRPGEVAEVICLVRDGRLIETVRRVAATPAVADQLADLLAGPTAQDSTGGMSTALAGLQAMVTQPGDGEARVEIAEPEESAGRTDEPLAYGQIVCTLTSRADVRFVTFTRDSRHLEVPIADGSLSAGPLYGSDYAALIGPA